MIYVCRGHERLVDSETVGVQTVRGKPVCNECYRHYNDNKMQEIAGTMFLAIPVLCIIFFGVGLI